MIIEEIKHALGAIGSNKESLKLLSENVSELQNRAKRHWLCATIPLEVADAHKTLAQRSLELTDSLNIAMVQRSWLGHADEVTQGLRKMSETMSSAEYLL